MNLEVVADDRWAATVAAAFQQELKAGKRLCLATGRTVAPVYQHGGDIDAVDIFLLDEFGGLPPGDPGRCHSMLQRDLLDHTVGQPVVHVPEVDSDDPERAAASYREKLADGGIDLAIVGLGANGHVGMNEPGTSTDARTGVVTLDRSTSTNAAASYGASVPPTWGITVGLAELLEASELWLLVTGSHKATTLAAALTGEIGPELPASFLRHHPDLVVHADQSAAGRLSVR